MPMFAEQSHSPHTRFTLRQSIRTLFRTERVQTQRSRHREVVVITGASAGVGRAAVRTFAQHGAHIALIARGNDGLDGARRDVEAAGGRALMLPVDVADATAVQAAGAYVESELGPIDVWVNNAMTSVFSPFSEMTADEFKRVTEVTYLGVVYGTQTALKYMLQRNRGTIVQVGSALAYRSIPLQSAYCGAKHAIAGFTDAVRCELIHDRSQVHITMVQMPALNTPQFGWVKSRLPHRAQPVPPIYQPELAADAIYWAAHHRRREWALGMSTIAAVVGNKIVPGLLDRYLGRTGYASQQTCEPADPNRPNNLWAPVAGDHGAHGAFDSRARSTSPEWWAEAHRGIFLLGVVGCTVAAGTAIWSHRQKAAVEHP